MKQKQLFKRLIFGDFHGHFDSLAQIYQDEKPYSVIHLGDYFDSFHGTVDGMKQAFTNLLKLRNDHLSDTKNGDFVLLLGNHDYHYLQYGLEQYSGYNKGYDLWAHQQLQELWDSHQLKLVEYDYTSKTLYSHAGVTNTWLKENRMDGVDVQYFNEVNLLHLRFTYAGGGDWYGDSVYSSPIWIRPNSLLQDGYVDENGDRWTQIVGHTHSTMPVCYYPKNNRVGYPKAEDYNFINTYEQRPILWIMDCMPKYYIREMITIDGEVVSREIVKNDKYKLYESKKY
ncbi:MAG: metallophosphoesterase [Clostridia bacterium]|nr:metallophosphoesterase [Clostridia bacterium]